MRRVLVAVPLSLLTLSSVASADGNANPASKDYRQFQLHRGDRASSLADTARARARAGDCKGALATFDAAVQAGALDPTIRRDRGLCHEKLGNAFPAMEDLRAYLTARMDAPDADQIREHLVHIEEETGVAARGQGGKDTSQSTDDTSTGGANGRVKRPGEDDNGTARGSTSFNYDMYTRDRQREELSSSSPLRYGQGVMLAPTYGIRWFLKDGEVSKDPTHFVGASLKYAVSRGGVVFADLGYVQSGSIGSRTAASGPSIFVGGELRFPSGKYGNVTPYVNLALGYEGYSTSATQTSTRTYQARTQLGLRFALASNLGIEVALNAGYALAQSTKLPVGTPDPGLQGLIALGANTGVVLAF